TRIVKENQENETIIESSNNTVPLDIVGAIPNVSYPTPFDEVPSNEEILTQNSNKKEEETEPAKIVEQVVANTYEEIEVVPFEEEVFEETNDLYADLTEKVYDRDYSLGECFEKNFIFNGYEDNKLKIISYAQGDDRKFLYKHFGLIKTFAQDVYGNEVELDFSKSPDVETKKKILNNNNINVQEKQENKQQDVKKEEINQENNQNNSNDTGSMIEDIEMGSGCVASMHNTSNPKPSQKELDLDDVMNSIMVNKAKELFDIKKITVRTRT
ncbi:MAG: DNA polymerase III subunit gamma/tau, partial [Poseidonibacter sp.]